MAKKKQSLEGLTIIELFSPSKDLKRKFKKDHCQGILSLSAKGKGDWELVDENLIFKDGVITRPSKGITEDPTEQG